MARYDMPHTVRRRRIAATIAAGSLGATLLVGTATGPVAAATVPTWRAVSFTYAALQNPTDIVQAGGRIFVPDTDSVHVFAADGSSAGTVSPVVGAREAVRSDDGSTVFVTQPSQDSITAIDTATLAITATYAVGDCPLHLAASGSLLFYSYGCSSDPGSSGALNHVDLDTGEVHSLAAPDASDLGYNAGTPTLVAADGSLYALDNLGMARVWPVTAQGLGAVRTASMNARGRFEIRGTVLALAGERVELFDTTTLTKTGTLGDEYYDLLGFSPDGSRIVASGIGSTLDIFDTGPAAQTGNVLLPVEPQNASSYGDRAVFSPDGSLVYWLASDSMGSGVHYSLAIASASRPPQLKVALTIAPPAKYPGLTRFTVKGSPNRAATLYVQDIGSTTTAKFSVTTDAAGVATVLTKRIFNGKAFVQMKGDVTHTSTQTTWIPFHEPVDMRVSVTPGYKTVNGVIYYAKATYARQYVHLGPARPGRGVRATLWRWTGKSWVILASQEVALSSTGNAATYLGSAVRGTRYRITFGWAGDRLTDAAKVTTPPFTVG